MVKISLRQLGLNFADKILQSREIGYVDAVPVINAVLEEIEAMQTEEKFVVIKESAKEELYNANDAVHPTRSRRRSIDYETSQDDLIESAYFKRLEVVVSEINRRFHENDDKLLALSRVKLPSQSELDVVKNYLDSQQSKRKEEDDEIGMLQMLFPVREAFPSVYKLLCGVESFPCSTTVNECSFSCLERVGVLGRVHMKNKRLRNLAFLSFEKALKTIKKSPIRYYFTSFQRLQES